MRFDIPYWLNDEQRDTLLENWDRYQAIVVALLSPATSRSTPIDDAVRLTLSEAAWKKDLLQRQAARTTSGGTS
ncbi:MAG: hypothetical protein WC326_12950 [Candidatus Delongbacteria bacterium]